MSNSSGSSVVHLSLFKLLKQGIGMKNGIDSTTETFVRLSYSQKIQLLSSHELKSNFKDIVL